MKDGLPQPLLNMSKESLIELMDSVAVNWLANDGVWFQAVEFSSGMNSDGLAVADTASRTVRHGVGRHRYSC